MEKILNNIPKHVALIMDGNGRWAKRQRLARTQGHMEGVKRVEENVSFALKAGIQVLTIYAFSTENWSRPQDEVSVLMGLFISALRQKAKVLNQNGIKIRFIGRTTGVPQQVLTAMNEAQEMTRNNSHMTLNVAFNYGSRAELVDGIKRLGQQLLDKRIAVDDINEELISDQLYTRGQPDVDLLVRTSGEIRVSNFLLWQISYAELYFTPKYWPEFTPAEFDIALKDFAARKRRYGGVDEE